MALVLCDHQHRSRFVSVELAYFGERSESLAICQVFIECSAAKVVRFLRQRLAGIRYHLVGSERESANEAIEEINEGITFIRRIGSLPPHTQPQTGLSPLFV